MKTKLTLLRTGVLSVSLLAWAGTAIAATVFEDFNTDPASRGWIGVNGPTTAGNNFGWTGSAVGGTFARSLTVRYYADTDLGGTLTRNDAFTMSGTMTLNNINADGNIYLGFLNTTDLSSPFRGLVFAFRNPAAPRQTHSGWKSGSRRAMAQVGTQELWAFSPPMALPFPSPSRGPRTVSMI